MTRRDETTQDEKIRDLIARKGGLVNLRRFSALKTAEISSPVTGYDYCVHPTPAVPPGRCPYLHDDVRHVLLLPDTQDLDVDRDAEEDDSGPLDESDHVVDVALALRAVVQGEPRRRLVLAHEGRRLHLRVVGAQVVVQVVEAVQEVAHRPAEHAQDLVVAAAGGHRQAGRMYWRIN